MRSIAAPEEVHINWIERRDWSQRKHDGFRLARTRGLLGSSEWTQ